MGDNSIFSVFSNMIICAFENSPSIPSFLVTKIVYSLPWIFIPRHASHIFSLQTVTTFEPIIWSHWNSNLICILWYQTTVQNLKSVLKLYLETIVSIPLSFNIFHMLPISRNLYLFPISPKPCQPPFYPSVRSSSPTYFTSTFISNSANGLVSGEVLFWQWV
jgi:hypothetical protein